LGQALVQVLLEVDMPLVETALLQFLTQLQPQAVVAVVPTTAALVLQAVRAVVVAVALAITQVAGVAAPDQREEIQRSQQAPTAANTALVLLGKDIPAAEVVAIFTLQVKAATV
jgi:hypothetical protein